MKLLLKIGFKWVLNGFYTFLSIPRFIISTLFFNTTNVINTSNREIIILGNGPSLLDNLKDFKSSFLEKEIFVVNDFAFSEFFFLLKPKHNIFADPGYWLLNVPEEMKIIRNRIWAIFNNNVDWELNLYFPIESKGSKVLKQLENPNLIIHFYRTHEAKGFDFWRFFLYRKNIASPKIQNVVHAAIYLAILSGSKRIDLFGVEHSWLPSIFIDENNRVCYNNDHFYSDGDGLKVWKNFKGENYILHDLLLDLHHTFKSYHTLSQYANYSGCEITNYTSGSFIDAFKKSKYDF